MAKSSDFGEINLDVRGSGERSRATSDAETPFRILILGDFSGRATRNSLETGAKLASRRPRLVDRDNFDEVLAKSGAELTLPPGISPAPLRFTELDDFHPDRLFQSVALFQRLRELRAKLSNPSTFAEAAAELGLRPGNEPRAFESAAERQTSLPDVSRMASGSLLDDAIGATEGRSGGEAPARKADDLAAFIRRSVAPHLVAKADPRQAELLSVIDQATSAQMRALLRLPGFQALEAAWRAVFFLVRRIETDASLEVFLLDVSKEELAADLASTDDFRQTAMYKTLVEQTARTPGAKPWAALAGNYTFGKGDLTLLTGLTQLAAAAGAPFIAGASLNLLGCESAKDLTEPRTWKDVAGTSEGKMWSALRSLAEASYLGLALPRFLLRLPYGKETDAAAQFDFEEMADFKQALGGAEREDYLWGNPAFLCVCLLAESFAQSQWSMRLEDELEVDGLPLHVYQENGESTAKPCAETLMTEDAAMRILEAGLMPVASLKNTDAVRLVRFQSVASPLKALSGRWG
ncbi:MAG: type VI secretion system contractile sheath domain-containing protein [Terriglobia bacterium]